ncbi:D-2-hydroxyacid dehydrogenase [Alphaproteobacteria bacterium KMM 3653]|uniref:D-2-hydroxyacid dehydrogenase n=1 Tax=Harenicola maris TaxID=2841044 RepID=A0AAP2G791_9RHOB|nr:D-2-hydroxyacid dehydrogenase [Harenicola maris]
MENAPHRTVLIKDTEAAWYRRELEGLCPQYHYLTAADEEEALRVAPDAGIIVGLAPALSERVIGAAPRLEWVQALTTGVDNLLSMEAMRPEVTLTNCGGFHGPQMSELAFLMMLSLNRDFPRMLVNQGQQKWERWPQKLLLGKTVAVVGVGAIAEDLTKRANAFGMTVTGVSNGREEVPGFAKIFKRAELTRAAAEADFLVVLLPYDAGSHHIINAEVFAAMKPEAKLINISRGGCVDELALRRALESGQIAGAGLDVFASEPLDPSDPIWSAPNVLITPHIGGMSDIYKQQALPLIAQNLNAYASGGAGDLSGRVQRGKGSAS